jgi:hypothetical protein
VGTGDRSLPGLRPRSNQIRPARLPPVIRTLLLSILIECTLAAGYSFWRTKPLGPLLLALIAANALTQLMLWAALSLNPGHYLATLLAAELLIWLVEAPILYYFPGARLRAGEALLLSLVMNLASFGIGWFLPV